VHDCAKPRVFFPNMEGVIGYGLFRSLLLTLDYPAEKMLVNQWHPLPKGHPQVVPMRMHVGVPQVPVTVGGSKTFADVDSGSNGGLEMQKSSLDGRLAGPPRPSGISVSIGEDYRSFSGRVNGSVFIGRVELESPIVEITRGDQRIGGEILQNLVLTFDYRSGLAAVSIPGSSRISALSPKLVSPSRYGTGLAFDDRWQVRDVIPGTSAQKSGIQPGDQLLAINGEPVQRMPKGAYQSMLAQGVPLEFTFRRQERTWTSNLAAEPLVQ
jgi:hypothetical protein